RAPRTAARSPIFCISGLLSGRGGHLGRYRPGGPDSARFSRRVPAAGARWPRSFRLTLLLVSGRCARRAACPAVVVPAGGGAPVWVPAAASAGGWRGGRAGGVVPRG